LPQRQTALVAKQAAEVDILCGGRLRLGVGIGWNAVEYDALGQDFRTRGQRMAEQVRLLRALWTQESVTFEGRWDKVDGAGLNPLPVQRPIPIWMGGRAEPVLKRLGRLADGWIPWELTLEAFAALVGYAREVATETDRRTPLEIVAPLRVGPDDSAGEVRLADSP